MDTVFGKRKVGLQVKVRDIIGVYGGPHCRSVYRNGDQVSYVITVYGCTVIGGRLATEDDEIAEVGYFTAKEASSLKLMPWMVPVLADLFTWHVNQQL